MPQNMKSVLIINADETNEATANKWIDWTRDNGISSVADKYVPNAEQTRKMLYE